MPFQLGYRQKNIRKKRKAPTFVGASEIEPELELENLANDQTNPEGRARLTRRRIMDLVFMVISKLSIARLQYRSLLTCWLLIAPLLFFKKLDLKGEHNSLSRSPPRITHVI